MTAKWKGAPWGNAKHREYIVTWMENGHERVKSFTTANMTAPYKTACRFARDLEIDVGVFPSRGLSVLGVERVS